MLNQNTVQVAVLVSGGGTNLQALLDAERDGRLAPGRIALVVSDREGSYALTRAREAGVEAFCLPQKGLDREAWEAQLLEVVRARGIRLVVLAGFLSILGPRFIAAFPDRIVNVHPSLLPAFGGTGCYGLKVHEMALRRGVKLTGATVHLVNEEPDGGPILLQQAVSVQPGDTPGSLQRRVMEEAEWVLLPRAVKALSQEILCKEQNK